MNPLIKTVLRDLGLLLLVPGGMAIISIPVCLFWGEYYAIIPFLTCAIASWGIGYLLYRCFAGAKSSRTTEAMITAAIGWGIIPLFAAIPFVLVANTLATRPLTPLTILEFQHPINAIFEAFSGMTSTGLTMALHESKLPHSLQWWRSFMEWVGGVGVIVLVVSLLDTNTDPYQLYSAEGRSKTINLTVRSTVRRIWWIYLLYTIAGVFWLKIVGMPWWDALNHGMTAISTGGFTITDDSIDAYAPLIQWAIIPIMIAGAISFPVHYRLLYKRRISALWGNAQHRALWVLLVIGALGLVLVNYRFKDDWLWRDSVFQWVSALGTCGFSTVTFTRWSETAKLLLSLAMIIGGTSGSTVGGIKLNRLVFLIKAVLWRFQRIVLRPHQLMRYKLNDEVVTEVEAIRRVEGAAVIFILWLTMLFVGVLILSEIVLPRYVLSDVIFEAASALGSVGLSTGITHPNLPFIGKLTLIIFMWMGRLEIIPVLLLFSFSTQHFVNLLSRFNIRAFFSKKSL
ncbi:cation transporter [Gloeothece citriformis PCC 7424]|uniref:Cation transporter n=1 Tax=Gloeothece citriformis (strain PCC 7424) TaxID=65393 RepID=B7KLB8_GLOC7|nr:TrkH family potassium uptake protein [Gloeothece citriformis]ACK72490.1 cation transporter [Gloeothece citriformis PCC 7424]